MFPDLTVGLISVLTDIVWRITVTWHAGNFCCKLIRFFQVGTTLFYGHALKFNIQNTGWSKSLCVPNDCIVIIRCTGTFRSLCVLAPKASTYMDVRLFQLHSISNLNNSRRSLLLCAVPFIPFNPVHFSVIFCIRFCQPSHYSVDIQHIWSASITAACDTWHLFYLISVTIV